jgi:hypothetical protein
VLFLKFDVVDIGHDPSNGLANSIAPNVGAIAVTTVWCLCDLGLGPCLLYIPGHPGANDQIFWIILILNDAVEAATAEYPHISFFHETGRWLPSAAPSFLRGTTGRRP